MYYLPIHRVHSTEGGGKRWLTLAIGSFLLVGGVCLFLWWWPGPSSDQRFVVPKGASARSVARALHEARLIGSTSAFRIWVRLSMSRNMIHPGVYRIKPGWSRFRVYQQIRHRPPL